MKNLRINFLDNNISHAESYNDSLEKGRENKFIVYEKNSSINSEKGYGIQLSVNSIKLLNKVGFQSINFDEKFHPNKLDFYSLKNKKKYVI